MIGKTMAEPHTPATGAAGLHPRGRRGGGRAGPLAIFAVASVAAIASDVATPVIVTIPYVGAGLVVLMIAHAVSSFRSAGKASEAAMIALVLPVALCGYAVFNLREKPPGQPPSGVVAQALPGVEHLQATMLPASHELKAALLIEAALKSGGDAAKAAAVEQIAELKSVPLEKYLYETAARFGDAAQKRRVVVTLLERQRGRPISVDLQTEDNLTLFSQYLDGSSILFTSVDRRSPGVRALLQTNKEGVVMAGDMSGGALNMTGKANLANGRYPLTLNAGLGPGLTFSGTFRLAKGPSVPFTIQPF
jgi:hypothetical protein